MPVKFMLNSILILISYNTETRNFWRKFFLRYQYQELPPMPRFVSGAEGHHEKNVVVALEVGDMLEAQPEKDVEF